MTELAVLRHEGSGSAAADVALAAALLDRVSRGRAPSTLRLYAPGPTVAFGRLDAIRPGFAAASRTARTHGFEPVVRAPGGHAAAYHRMSVVVDLAMADPDPINGVQERFADLAELLAGALRAVGADARVGPVPGEFCPGAFSVNEGGRAKLVGTAQRIVRGGWLFAGSVVVRDAAPVRAVLTGVYDALDLAWDPATAVALADTVPAVTPAAVGDALVAAFAARHALVEAELDPALEADARERAGAHVAPA
jgi:lipoate-protein ligase A